MRFARPLPLRVGDGDGRQEGRGVGVGGSQVHVVGRTLLDDLSQVHDGDAVAQVPHHRQVVGDEQVGQPQPVLQFAQEVDDL